MRTADPKVFAAGDGAFGPSTIVNAMYHGHRAAYYVKALPRGRRAPAPLPDAVQDAARAGRAGRALGGVRARAPGVPRPRRQPGRVSRRSSRPTTPSRPARGGALLPLRRRDRLGRLQRPHARGHLRHGADDAAGRAQAARALHEAADGRQRAPLQPAAADPRRHRVPAREPLATRDRPVPRRLPRGRPSSAAARSSSRSPFLVAGFDDVAGRDPRRRRARAPVAGPRLRRPPAGRRRRALAPGRRRRRRARRRPRPP